MNIRFMIVFAFSVLFTVPSLSQFRSLSHYFSNDPRSVISGGLSGLAESYGKRYRYYSLTSLDAGLTTASYATEYRDFKLSEFGNDSSDEISNVNTTRLVIVGGALVTTMAAIHTYMQIGWWKDNRTSFHFQEDLIYGMSVDKIGHFWGGDFLGYIIRKSLLWANLKDEEALWYGAGGSLLFQTFTETEDGFSAWGFDRVDWLCDLGGALLSPARYYFPFLKAIDLKISYHPSDLLGNPGGIGFRGQKHIIIDDYEGQTFWASLKLEDLLPVSVDSYWPDFLCIALGYGVRGMATPNTHRVFFISPDIDFTRLIPQSTSFLRTLSEALNFIHVPLPAIRIHPTFITYGLYF